MRIKIYQIDPERDHLRVKFYGLQETQKIQQVKDDHIFINSGIYNEVFNGEVKCNSLEGVYQLFNLNHPPTHRGHSLSISDIIEISENSSDYLQGFFFCDRTGFEHVNFSPEQSRKPENLIRVVMVEPDKPAYEAEIENSLISMQRVVQGHIEVTNPFGKDTVIVSNEEAKIEWLPCNRKIFGEIYAGDFFIAGDNHDGEFCSLTDSQVQEYLLKFKEPDFINDENMDFGIQMQ